MKVLFILSFAQMPLRAVILIYHYRFAAAIKMESVLFEVLLRLFEVMKFLKCVK